MSHGRDALGYFEPDATSAFDPRGVAKQCIESGSWAILLDEGAIPPAFFDLSTRLAGELLHMLSIYRVRLAAVVPDPRAHSEPFQDFVREANRGRQYRFFTTRADAIAWLES